MTAAAAASQAAACTTAVTAGLHPEFSGKCFITYFTSDGWYLARMGS